MNRYRHGLLPLAFVVAGLLLIGGGAYYLFAVTPLYRATAVVQVQRPGNEIGHFADNPLYFLGGEIERIQSRIILFQVISNLDLVHWNEATRDGERADASEVYQLLKRRLELRHVSNTDVIDISFPSRDPAKAAEIANEIARVYRASAFEQQRELQSRFVEVLAAELDSQRRKVKSVRAETERLRERLHLSDGHNRDTAATEDQRLEAYISARQRLKDLENSVEKLARRIDEERARHVLQGIPKVTLVSLATPPIGPFRPNRWIGTGIMANGVLMLLAGVLLQIVNIRSETS